MTELEVSDEFIDENKKILDQTIPKSRKSGPHSKQERKKRRDEVYRLHFEHGYSARKISDLMKINRHTIDSDVQFLYSTIQNEDKRIGMYDLVNKELIRLEFQRNRLMKTLDITNTVQENNQIERLIFDIDSKLTNTCLKIGDSRLKTWDMAVDYINKWMKDNHKDTRYVLYGNLLTTSENKKNRIHEILNKKEN